MDEFKYLTWNEKEAVGVISIQNSGSGSGSGMINILAAYCNFFIKRRIECGEDFLALSREVARCTDSFYGGIAVLNIMYF